MNNQENLKKYHRQVFVVLNFLEGKTSLTMPEIKIAKNSTVKKKYSVKFPGLMLDENTLQKDDDKTTEQNQPKIMVY